MSHRGVTRLLLAFFLAMYAVLFAGMVVKADTGIDSPPNAAMTSERSPWLVVGMVAAGVAAVVLWRYEQEE